VPVVSAAQPPEALSVLQRVAAERDAPLRLVGTDWTFRALERSLECQALEVQGGGAPARLEIPLLGAHQVENAALAFAALEVLGEQGLPAPLEAVQAGFRSARWPGRFEIARRAPFVILDGAHNADSAARLAQAMRDYFPGRRVALVFGVSADKDAAGMLDALLAPGTGVELALVTRARHPRALDPEELADAAQQRGVRAQVSESVARAVQDALQWAAADGVVLATGSLFVVAEARAAVMAG
jgi:dihydrofolate synthase/folylpolyglutamate synthase